MLPSSVSYRDGGGGGGGGGETTGVPPLRQRVGIIGFDFN